MFIFFVCNFQAAITGIYTLPDIGLILEKLMGHGYRSNYTRRRFRTRYATTLIQPNALRSVRIEYNNRIFLSFLKVKSKSG